MSANLVLTYVRFEMSQLDQLLAVYAALVQLPHSTTLIWRKSLHWHRCCTRFTTG